MKLFVAQNGRTLEVDVQPSTGVAALQNMLVPLCDIPAADQILILSGKPLDARRQLSAYGLPAAEGAGADSVFLYSKALMRQNAPMPALEVLTPITINANRLEQVPYEPHMLDAALSPLISALPQYERSFLDHLSIGQAFHGAMQERLSEAARLAQEMAVQAAAIEAARSNVEHHYTYICAHFREFMAWFQGQAQSHAEVLGRFERDLRLLALVSILPAAQTQQYKCLGDVVPEEQYSDWAVKCSATHENLVKRVGEVDSMFQALRAEVEALFLTGPSVSLEAISGELQNMHAHVANEECVLQVLQRDCTQVQRLVEEAVRQLSAPMSASSATPLDNCQLMEAMNDNHNAQLLPRLSACNDSVTAFCQRCIDSKNQMTADVVGHLRSISGQQSKIRGLRQKLQILREATAKQDTAVSHLLFVRRVPAVYRQCLAECMRRAAFGELFAGQAGQLAERMGRLRQKEAAKREGFLKHAEGYVPRPVLGALGLLGQPAHCQISVPATEPGLLTVTLEDIQNVPISAEAPDASRSSVMMGASQQQPPTPTSARAGDQSASAAFASPLQIPEGDGEGDAEAEAEAGGGTPRSLEMENARLRAEVATQYAHEAARSLLAGDASHMAASLQRSLQLGEPQASPGADQAAVARFRAALAAREEVEAHLESELAAARAQAASYEHRIRQLEGRLLRSAMRTSPSASMRGSGRSSASSSSSFSGSGHLAPVSEGVEGRPVRRSLRDSQDVAKDSVAASTGAPQTGLPPDGAKETAAAASRSAQTGQPQVGPREAGANVSGSQPGGKQHLLRNEAISVESSQTGSAPAKGADEGRGLPSKQAQGARMSGQDRQPVVRGSADDTHALPAQASPSSTNAPAGVHERALPNEASRDARGSSSGSALPAGSSQAAYNWGASTAAEESRGEASVDHAVEEVVGFGQERLPQQKEQGGQRLAPRAQEHAAALVDATFHKLDQGLATGETTAEPGRPAATRTSAELQPLGAARLGTPFAAAAGTPQSSPGKESSLVAQASDSALTAGSALPFAASTAISGLSAMPSLAPHNPPHLNVPAPPAQDAAAGVDEAPNAAVQHFAAAGHSPKPLPALAAPAEAEGALEAPSTPAEASAAGASPAPTPDLTASEPPRTQGSG